MSATTFEEAPQEIAETDLAAADYTGSKRSCDIVMKGGITSGVVYPKAVCEMAQTYRFRNVGGTSAGAIAAAATAAAEYGRETGGFNQLAALPQWLGGGTNLRDLFQPQPATRKLYAVLLAAIDRGPGAAVVTALRLHPLAVLAGALPGLALAAVALAAAIANGSTGLVVAAALIGVLAGLPLTALCVALLVGGLIAWEANRKVPDNGFGLCSGGGTPEPGGPQPLTAWLAQLLDDVAQPPDGQPLTFGHLWAGPGDGREDVPDDPDDRWLQLAMMTTNLTNRSAHQLPWDARDWFFKPEEFRSLFPPDVCAWMEAHSPDNLPFEDTNASRRSRMRLALAREQGLLALPAPADLPVVVATRMSLSFPILLSAVPLWRFDMTREDNHVLASWQSWAAGHEGFDPLGPIEHWPAEERPEARPRAECCWFSDGGISSNFPVHFFDRLVPRWPTFALNLRPFPFGETRDADDERNNTWMAESNNDGWKEWWYRFPEKTSSGFKDRRLGAFLSSIVRTMQNRVDEAQMRVPGYRDRVAHVSMEEGEGGMNLTMTKPQIDSLGERGRAAAGRLVEAYTQPDGPDRVITWDNHRWVRLRSSLCVLEEMHKHFVDGFDGPAENGEQTYAELVERLPDSPPPGYPWSSVSQREIAENEIGAIKTATERGGDGGTVADGAPSPPAVGKIVPKP